jgi:HJR/Mrr/RecB family endonuclease
MRKPEPEDFGMTNQEYKQLLEERSRISKAVCAPPNSFDTNIFCKAFLDVFIMSVGMGAFGGFAGFLIGGVLKCNIKLISICGAILGAAFSFIIFFKFTYNEQMIQKQLSDPKYDRIKLYNEAMRRYELCREEYWKSLRGVEFEKALANLYRSLGHSVQETKGSHDEGIDLILDEKIIVQCKGHEKSISVSIIRELYGTLKHQTEFESAVLACPAGFTNGVRAFAYGKPIELIALKEIIEMAERVAINIYSGGRKAPPLIEGRKTPPLKGSIEEIIARYPNPSPEGKKIIEELKSRGLLDQPGEKED